MSDRELHYFFFAITREDGENFGFVAHEDCKNCAAHAVAAALNGKAKEEGAGENGKPILTYSAYISQVPDTCKVPAEYVGRLLSKEETETVDQDIEAQYLMQEAATHRGWSDMADFVVTVRLPAAKLGDFLTAVACYTEDFEVSKAPIIEVPEETSKTKRDIFKKVTGRNEDGLTNSQLTVLDAMPIGAEVTSEQMTKPYMEAGYNASGLSGVFNRLIAAGKVERVRSGIYRRIG